jgi:hypothetical protein
MSTFSYLDEWRSGWGWEEGEKHARPERFLSVPFQGWNIHKMTEEIDEFVELSELDDDADYIRTVPCP